MNIERKRFLIAFIFILLTIFIALLFFPFAKSESPAFEAFSNSECSSQLSALDWGKLNAGGTATQTFYVKNLDTNELTQLSYYMENLSPQNAEGFLHLEGTPSNVNLKQNEAVKIDLTLSVDPTIKDVDLFSFDVVVVAGFSEDLTPSPSSSGGGGGGGGDGYIEEHSVVLPSEEDSPSNNDDLIFVVIVCLFVYFVFGKKR